MHHHINQTDILTRSVSGWSTTTKYAAILLVLYIQPLNSLTTMRCKTTSGNDWQQLFHVWITLLVVLLLVANSSSVTVLQN